MSARATHDVVATIGEYTDREGNTKKRYMNCGVVFTNDEGNMSVKLNALPISPDWSGFLSLYQKKDRQDHYGGGGQQHPPREPQRQVPPQQSTQNPNQAELLNDGDDIPF